MAITLLRFNDDTEVMGDASTVTSLSMKNPRKFYVGAAMQPGPPVVQPETIYRFVKFTGDPAIFNFASKDIKWRYVVVDATILAKYNETVII
jgi:hypothetical protein